VCSSRVWQVFCLFSFLPAVLTTIIAEFRGPGVHHNFEDSDSGYDVDIGSRSASENAPGRIILLGDGTEVLTDSDDTEMFDHGEEDKDLESQVQTSGPNTSNPDALPEKVDLTDPKYKAVADKVHNHTAESADKKATETTADSNK
jgi:protein phosphatase 2C family protein 2/3